MKTKVCNKFSWMIPYLEEGKKFISRKHKIARLGAWTLGKSRGANEFAALIQSRLGEPHRIWIHTHYYSGDEVKEFSKIDLLKLLAHEIAHTEDWNHTPKHAALEAKITRRFMKMLAADGYISEEIELK